MSKCLMCLTEKSPAELCKEINDRKIEPMSVVVGRNGRFHAFYMGKETKKVEAQPAPKPEAKKAEATKPAASRSKTVAN